MLILLLFVVVAVVAAAAAATAGAAGAAAAFFVFLSPPCMIFGHLFSPVLLETQIWSHISGTPSPPPTTIHAFIFITSRLEPFLSPCRLSCYYGGP